MVIFQVKFCWNIYFLSFCYTQVSCKLVSISNLIIKQKASGCFVFCSSSLLLTRPFRDYQKFLTLDPSDATNHDPSSPQMAPWTIPRCFKLSTYASQDILSYFKGFGSLEDQKKRVSKQLLYKVDKVIHRAITLGQTFCCLILQK